MTTFSAALDAAKEGKAIAREGWNGKGMFVFLIPGNEAEGQKFLPYLAMSTVQGDVVPWLASQTDILAEDWRISEE